MMSSAFKRSRQAGMSTTAQDTTQAVGEDIIYLVATFASCRDLCTLGSVCQRFAHIPTRKSLWLLRALDILHSLPEAHAAMSELHLNSYRQLVQAFTSVKIPAGVLGMWRRDVPARSWAAQQEILSRISSAPTLHGTPAEEEEARGELLRISLIAGGFLCETILPDGTRRCVFTIRVTKAGRHNVRVGFFSSEEEASATIGGDGWVPGQSTGEAFLEYAVAVPTTAKRTTIRPSGKNAFFLDRGFGKTCRFTKIEASPTLPAATTTTAAASRATGTNHRLHHSSTPPAALLQNLCGLWSAPYGSHGLEIVQLSISHTSSPDASLEASVDGATRQQPLSLSSPSLGVKSENSRSIRGFASSSTKTSGSESVCTSGPATDSSSEEGCSSGFGSAAESDDCSSDEDNESESSKSFSSPTTKRAMRAAVPTDSISMKPDQGVGEKELFSDADDDRIGLADPCVPLQLFGVKATGDANVPAGKTSFAINLDTTYDVGAQLDSDRRPVILFLPSGTVMANLANRRDKISFWCKGRGQINRVPGIWSPEWVDVDFVAYQPESRCAFSVVFKQPAQAVRVIMDFERTLGMKEEWPEWPTHPTV